MDARAAWRAFSSYQGAPADVRAFVAARFLVAPLGPLAAELQGRTGRVLSLGSGLSIVERYLAELEPGLTFEGVDLDVERVEIVSSTQGASPRVHLHHGDVTKLHEHGEFDIVLVCDALHHFARDSHGDVAHLMAEALRPGGIALVKDLDVAPHWKHEWNRLHDRIVAGPDPITCRTPSDVSRILMEAGLSVERADRIEHRFSPYAHYLIRARKPL